MPRLFVLLVIAEIFTFQYLYCQQSIGQFHLTGKIEGVDYRYIYLSYYDDTKETGILDSSFITNGLFAFSGKITQPAVAFIKLNKKEAVGLNATDIIIEPANMFIQLKHDNFLTAHLSGSKTQDDYEQIRAKRFKVMKNHPLLFDSSYLIQVNLNDSLSDKLALVLDTLNQIDFEYFHNKPTSYLTAYLLQYHSKSLSSDSLALFYNRLDEQLKQHPVTQTLRSRLKNMKAGSVGTLAPVFFAKDVNGNEFYSGFLKGNYVLLDFWASWCVPCRQNNPHLIDLYNKYKDRGLRIVGIADDRDSVKWKEAIAKDKTNIWTHIRREVNPDLKSKGLNDPNDISDRFGVSTLPTYILVDKFGVIVSRFEEDNASILKLSKMLESFLP